MVISQCNKSAYKIETHQGRTNRGNEPLGITLLKMLWKFIKIQNTTVFTSATSFEAIH